jgi:hypothetical protein
VQQGTYEKVSRLSWIFLKKIKVRTKFYFKVSQGHDNADPVLCSFGKNEIQAFKSGLIKNTRAFLQGIWSGSALSAIPSLLLAISIHKCKESDKVCTMFCCYLQPEITLRSVYILPFIAAIAAANLPDVSTLFSKKFFLHSYRQHFSYLSFDKPATRPLSS